LFRFIFGTVYSRYVTRYYQKRKENSLKERNETLEVALEWKSSEENVKRCGRKIFKKVRTSEVVECKELLQTPR